MQQLVLGTGTAIWWLTEPHWPEFNKSPGMTKCTSYAALIDQNLITILL